MFWIGFNQHTAPPITKGVGRTERELQLWSHGEEEREELHGSFQLCFRLLSIVILPWMHQSPTQRNSAWVAPKNRPSGVPSHSTSLFRVSGEAPIHLSNSNSTIFSPRNLSLSNLRESKSHSSQQYLRTLYENSSGTKYTAVDHLPRAKHWPKGTRDIAMNTVGKELTIYKCISK